MSKNSFVCSRYVLLIFTLIFLLILLICAPPPVGTLLLSPLKRHYDPGQKRKKEKGKEEKETSVRASTRRVTGSGLNLCFKTFSLDCLFRWERGSERWWAFAGITIIRSASKGAHYSYFTSFVPLIYAIPPRSLHFLFRPFRFSWLPDVTFSPHSTPSIPHPHTGSAKTLVQMILAPSAGQCTSFNYYFRKKIRDFSS